MELTSTNHDLGADAKSQTDTTTKKAFYFPV
jgi:hypothetical protein